MSSHTSPKPSGLSPPHTNGQLILKIAEARGLRTIRGPYVIVTFQRNVLELKDPLLEDQNDIEHSTRSPGIPTTGNCPVPLMAIPTKSQQSFADSPWAYRNATAKERRLCINPKWDAKVAFDVVGWDSHVNISIYDRIGAADEFLGHVDLEAHLTEDNPPVRAWYPLRGRGNTESATGDIYIEMTFQQTEKKCCGPQDFKVLKLIGTGTYGQVYQVRKKDTKRLYAMKVLQKKAVIEKEEVAHTIGERNILAKNAMLDSPFVVGLEFSFQTPTDLYLVTDYMPGGELFWHLRSEGRFDEGRTKFYTAELILALQYLHLHNIVYRDLKPENILLDATGHITLCDFGLSKADLTKDATTNTFCGTTEYLAPEVVIETAYTMMVDFWSLGVLVFEMCCGWNPFYAEDTQQTYDNILFGKVRFPKDTLSTEGRNFVKRLLNRNPKHRLGAGDGVEELKRHQFFSGIEWEALSKKLITPPFKPKIMSETDTSNFDPEFTNACAAIASTAASPLSPGIQANFKGFTFVDESSIDEHMRGRSIEDNYHDINENEKQYYNWGDPLDAYEDGNMLNGSYFEM